MEIQEKIKKVFYKTRVGDKIAFLKYDETGGIYKVIDRFTKTGVGGLVILTLERTTGNKEKIILDLHKDGPLIATIDLIKTDNKGE